MKKFFLGVDIGTESIGMACTDAHYNLLRAKGKDLWAVRLFDEAKDASERRAKRTARRRLQRRRQRVELLQGLFAPLMEDKTFFLRLNNSGLHQEDKDKRLLTEFSLFADVNYTDTEFYKDFPTIFHLRKALIEGTNKKVDLRHYYLALHHIIKYRGHFLFEGESMSDIRDIRNLFKSYNDYVGELGFDFDITLDIDKAEAFKDLAISKKGKNDKKREGVNIFAATNTEKKEWIALLIGATVSVKKLFGGEFEEKYKEQKSFSFNGLTDENFEAMSENLEEEHFQLLCLARDIYNFIVFEKVLSGNENISSAMVALYEKHKFDLKTLKKFIKQNYSNEIYYKIFRSQKETSNYANYIGYTQNKNQKHNVKKQLDVQEFYKFLKKTLGTSASDQETLNYILLEIENRTFLPKILNADNGLFPHQINGMELDLILKNLCAQYPVFKEKDESGFTLTEKIKKIFLFKIPYYVGPLNTSGNNAWMVRQEGKTEKITPWNFDEIVDKAKSNEGFIRRMTNKCTYLHNQDVLPKGSMYYQAFDTLNQINKLTIGGGPISVELKQKLFQNVCLKNKKVTTKQIKEYLLASGQITQEELKENSIGGFDMALGLKANMSSYVLFKEKFGALVDDRPDIFENIVLWHTLNTDKGLVEQMIRQSYADIPEIQEQIKWLKALTAFNDFGRLSKKLLYEIVGGIEETTGEVYTILNRLYHTNENFNQLLFSENYGFLRAIEDENVGNTKEEITYEDLKELYVSPMVRRGIWQALTMADEYVKAVGKAPDKIFIEVTRQDGEKGDKGRKSSRKNKLLERYKEIGADCRGIEELTRELAHQDMTESRLRSERLYLYFLQLGKCAYTGNSINLEELMGNRYDVDHIIPQSMTKDDSIDNKVLVERQKNAEKTNQYPLPVGFTNQQGLWLLLKDKGLMSESKYNRLMRIKPLGEDDFKEFINRQLVVTNQTIKAVAELLKQKYEPMGTKIVYSKAKNVDDFKQKHNIVKCRETNDLHHARDAYLNIVVGNIYDTKFTSKYAYFYSDKEGTQREYNLDNLYRWKIEGAWNGASDIERVKKIVARTSMCVTKYAYTNNGAFYDETIYSKQDGAIASPRKNCLPYNQTEKYGGFKSLKTAYFAIVQSKDKKGNLLKTVEAIPVLIDYQARQDKGVVIKYLQAKGLIEPRVIVQKLKMKSLVSIDGYKVWIAGVTGNQILIHNAQQWFTNENIDFYIKQLVKYIEKDKAGQLSASEKAGETIPLTRNRQGITLYATKKENLEIYNLIIDKLNKKTYQGLSSVRAFRKKFQGKTSLFEELTTFEQIKVLLQIIRFMKCNAECADLTLLKEGANCGKLLISKNITDVDFSIIHQSPCGLVERIQKV